MLEVARKHFDTPDMNAMLEERYKQLERNFQAVVAQLQSNADSSGPLQTLLDRLDADLKLSLIRAEATGAGAEKRLEERTAILQRNFATVVDLIEVKPGRVDRPAASEVAGESDGSPFSRHPWQLKGGSLQEDGAYTAPPTASRRPLAQHEKVNPHDDGTFGKIFSSPSSIRQYESFLSADIAHAAPQNPSATLGEHTPVEREREDSLRNRIAELESALEKTNAALSAQREEHSRMSSALAQQMEDRLRSFEAKEQACCQQQALASPLAMPPSPMQTTRDSLVML